ncbi:MAG: tetratricopeptide repeat protein [Cyanothece sp. SIO2G6]|nr:tetratricopeptide repeat protein [Cyanothece sp. SIO2G6]
MQSTTLITSRERLREASVTVETYLLRSLALEAWQTFFASRSLATDTPALEALHNAYGGNAKAMEIISGAITQDFDGDVDTYWQDNQDDLFIERDLEDLVKEQFERLQAHNLDAYNLLCRMGCYRYQDVPTVPVEGLFCLMWDVPEKEHKRVVKVLRDRSLVEFSDHNYWLHPVIRAEAIHILRSRQDWEETNEKAARFWTISTPKISTVQDALIAFESYFHYLSIFNFNAACGVILMRRTSKYEWYASDGGELLYNITRRFGFPRKTINAINSVIQEVENDFSSAALWLGLSIFYVITGDLCQSIDEAKKAANLIERIELSKSTTRIVEEGSYIHPSNKAKVAPKVFLERVKLASLMTEALCHIYLLNLEVAQSVLEEVISLEILPENEGFYTEAKFSLCLLLSEYKRDELKTSMVDEVEGTLRNDEALLGEWCRGYGFLFMGETRRNLGNLGTALDLYKKAIASSEESGYRQIQARAMTGLAQIFRIREEFEKALSYHSEAERILDSIEAKCDLAESHLQLGLTYREMKNIDRSNSNIQRAIELFSEMKAPKQVERVKKEIKKSDV